MEDLNKLFKWLDKNVNFMILDDDIDLDAGIHPLEREGKYYIDRSVVNLDKPRGPTSHQVATWVKRILEVEKTGHGGTLDPGVSGVLPIGVNKATPAMRYIVGSAKEYVGILKIHGDVSEEELDRVLSLFKKGRIYQKPPFRSSVRRKLRTREIYEFKVIEKDGRNILFRIKCESGFYVRKLAHDIGLILGVGAHLDELRRTAAGPFEEKDIVTLYELYAAKKVYEDNGDDTLVKRTLKPFEIIFKDFPKIVVKDTAVASIAYGAQLKRPGIYAVSGSFDVGDLVALFTKRSEVIATAKALVSHTDLLNMKKGQVTETQRVFIDRDLYPKMWNRSQDG